MQVEIYQEEADGHVQSVVQDEASALLGDSTTQIAVAELLGWLRSVRNGKALPYAEPDAPKSNGLNLKYRCVGPAIVIFAILGSPATVLVLLFGQAASTYPRTADLTIASERLQRWSSCHE